MVLADWICQAGHVSHLCVFPLSAVALNLQNFDLAPAYTMVFVIHMLGKS
jgi:hypothetical protein